MKKLIRLFIFLTLTTSPLSAHAGKNQAVEGLEALRRNFSELSDFTAEITQEKQLALLKKKMLSKGVIRFKKSGIFYMELFPPHASRLLLKDDTIAVRLVAEGVTNRMPLPREESLQKWFAYLARPITELPDGVDVRSELQGNLWVVQIFPKAKEGGVKEVQLTFTTDGELKRLVLEERNRDRTVIRFANMRRNVGLQDKDFKLE